MAKLSEASTGAVFGRLTVLRTYRAATKTRYRVFADCVCECGKPFASRLDALGVNTLSCCCLNLEHTVATGKSNRTHGMSGTGTYKSWADMWARCTASNNPKLDSYLARMPPKEWLDFDVFYRDMGEKPEGYSIERVNNNLPYGKDNCEWVPVGEQSKNRSNVRRVAYKGSTVSVAEAARLSDVSRGNLYYHLNKGKSLSEILGSEVTELGKNL